MACKNCHHPLTDHDKFCPQCGAKVVLHRITLGNIWSEFAESFFNWDNKIFRTFKTLYADPKEVVQSYINGVRKRYLSPISYFAISVTIGGLYVFIFSNWIDTVSLVDEQDQAIPAQVQREIIEASMVFMDYQSFSNFLLIPIAALVCFIVFYNDRRYNYSELFVVFLYAFSHINLSLYIVSMPLLFFPIVTQIIAGIFAIVYPIYFAVLLYQLYELNLGQIVVKSLLSILVGIPLLLLFYGILFGSLFYLGVFDEFLELVKKSAELQKQAG